MVQSLHYKAKTVSDSGTSKENLPAQCHGEILHGLLQPQRKIVVENGAMDANKKYRGKLASVILSYAKDMENDLKTAKPDRVFITHSGCDPEVVNAVRSYLESLSIFQEILETRAGGVISSHCGPGTLGVLFITQK